ncbi:MAG: DUF6282 family protein, partial [Deltaproteobacteria bacterium]|nr:DUF6282 family protein [Deltaproteobacteria bacterium]
VRIMTPAMPLEGAFDLHTHSSPSHFPRRFDDWELAESLCASGMGGAILKFHAGGTAARAALVNKRIGREVLFGSITLNAFVGGLNPVAVEGELLLGAKMVWLPTIHAANHIAYYGGTEWNHLKAAAPLPHVSEGIAVCGPDGELLPETRKIIDLVAANDVCLATGHLSPGESAAVCRAAVEAGVRRIVLTHPDFETQAIPLAAQIELARMGVLIEKTAIPLKLGHVTVQEMARSINAIGAEHCLIATDFGQRDNPEIPGGLRAFMETLHENGVSIEHLRRMVIDNARYVLKV